MPLRAGAAGEVGALCEVDVYISAHRPKQGSGFDCRELDYVITVCDNARENGFTRISRARSKRGGGSLFDYGGLPACAGRVHPRLDA